MKRAVALALIAFLAACKTADQATYPSLAIRPAERVTGTLEPAPPTIAPPPSPAVSSQLSQLAADVASAHRAFETAAPAARSAVAAARGSGPGAESWSVAQVAVAGLESSRSRAMIALADLDRLYAAGATEGTDLAALATARDAAIAQVEQENATISGLLAALQ